MSSKLLTINEAGTTATVADAELADIVTTAFSSTKVLTGAYAWAQRLLLVAAGAAGQEYRRFGSFNVFASR